MESHLFANGIDQVERALDALWAVYFAGRPDGHEDGVEPALAHPRDVQMAARVAMPEVEFLEQQSLRRVRVGIDHDGARMEFAGAGGDVVYGHGSDQQTAGEDQPAAKP